MRYEESKLQFEACLRETILKQQAQRLQPQKAPQIGGAKTRFSSQSKNINLDNILPGFPQRMVNDNDAILPDKIRGGGRIKARGGASLSNTHKDHSKKLKLNKDDDGPNTGPESTKSGAKKTTGLDDKKDEEEELAPIEEVKKVPRYFPPRKMPNPFTEAANE